jgi:serine/threonine-protein kinase
MSGPFGERRVWSRNADGTGTPTVVVDGGSWAEGLFTRDGEWLVLRFAGLIGGAEGDRAILAMRPGVDQEPVPLIATDFIEQSPTLSPDGRWMAYESNETGQSEIFVRPFPDVDDGKWQLSTNGGVGPLWSHGGGEIFFFEGQTMMSARVETEPSFRVTGADELFVVDPDVLIGDGTNFYDVSADDQRFLMGREVTASATGDAPEYVLVQNFFEELKRRVPN